MGIEPTFSAWEADVLPLNYTRNFLNTLPGIPAVAFAIPPAPAAPSTGAALAGKLIPRINFCFRLAH